MSWASPIAIRFPINDGDNTLVGFNVLNWVGLFPDENPILKFWDSDHFRTYPDERGASVSVNIHGLMALRNQPGFPNRHLAVQVTAWLKDRMNSKNTIRRQMAFVAILLYCSCNSRICGVG